MAERTAEADLWPLLDRYENPRELVYALATTVTLGLAGGFLSFAFNNTQLLPPGVRPDWLLVALATLGMYASELAGQLDRSMSLVLGASGIAFVVHIVAWIWPLLMLVGTAPLAGIAYLAVHGPLGEAILGFWFTFPVAFLAGFLTYVLVGGYFRP